MTTHRLQSLRVEKGFTLSPGWQLLTEAIFDDDAFWYDPGQLMHTDLTSCSLSAAWRLDVSF